ncbi:CRYD protein, partial [Spelaeornis formosus]|nr:CRYD protein [Elachura formosa]
KVDYNVCSNYGNWLYGTGLGKDPWDIRKFNMIKQGLDYDGTVNLVWLFYKDECMQGIKGTDIHSPWALSSAAAFQAGVTLGETYPWPGVTAPAWSHQMPGGSPRSRDRRGPAQHKDRGIDFYFSWKKDA